MFQRFLQLIIRRKKTRLKGIIKFIFVGFNPIDTNDILDNP